jgi:hypothetical protein
VVTEEEDLRTPECYEEDELAINEAISKEVDWEKLL